MKVLSAQETAALLPYPALAEQLKAVLADKRTGKASAPQRLHVPLNGGGVLLLMPAADDDLTITKLVTVHTRNASRGLPSVQAEVLVLDTRTGERLLWLDGGTVTARRTAALSLLAAQTLAPETAGPLLIVGAGTQGRSHLDAMVQGLGVKQVYVTSRDPAHAAELAAYASSIGIDAHPVEHAEEVLDRVTLVVTATTSPVPVLPAQVPDGVFIAAVGAYQPDRAELPPDLVRRAQIFVDTLEGAKTEAGDLILADVDWSQVIALEDAIGSPRRSSGPVIFKSVGHALWDLAAARLVWSKVDSG